MAYREACSYVVLCDGCGLAGPEGTGWRTPGIADQAALRTGWAITTTEHLCPACAVSRAAGVGDLVSDPEALTQEPPSRPDVCWPLNLPGSGSVCETVR